jgi:hypothetical protein
MSLYFVSSPLRLNEMIGYWFFVFCFFGGGVLDLGRLIRRTVLRCVLVHVCTVHVCFALVKFRPRLCRCIYYM